MVIGALVIVPGTVAVSPPTIDIEDGVNTPDLSAARSRRCDLMT